VIYSTGQISAFGIGSVIYSGLEFGRFFELEPGAGCMDYFLAVTPLIRISFVLIQMLFIFANNKVRQILQYLERLLIFAENKV
jgi:hypothetical protein